MTCPPRPALVPAKLRSDSGKSRVYQGLSYMSLGFFTWYSLQSDYTAKSLSDIMWLIKISRKSWIPRQLPVAVVNIRLLARLGTLPFWKFPLWVWMRSKQWSWCWWLIPTWSQPLQGLSCQKADALQTRLDINPMGTLHQDHQTRLHLDWRNRVVKTKRPMDELFFQDWEAID